MNIKEKWVSWEEFDLLFPGLSPTSPIDFGRVGGLTPGSIPFAGATGFLAQDNANLFWNDTLNVLEVFAPTLNTYIGKGVIGAGNAVGAGRNVYVGYEVGHDAEDAAQNVIMGYWAGYKHTSGGKNTLLGYYTGYAITTSQLNTCVGANAGAALTTGVGQNTLLGVNAGGSINTGYYNISIGKDSGTTIITGKGNICIGLNAESHDTDANYRIAIGYQAVSKEDNLCAIGGGNVSYHLAIFHKREFRFYEEGIDSYYVGFKAPALAGNQIWVLPTADGDANDFLQTDGGGNLSWAAVVATDEKVKIDAAATAGYLGAAFNDGVLRTGATLTYADGGDFVTLGVDPSAIKLDDLGAPDDNTDLDFSTAKHGLVPKGTDVGNFLKDDGTWAAGGGGESNTASNQGSGVSIYFQKVGVDLQFNAIKSENNRLAVALDGVTHDVELTLVEGNIDHDALLNTHANPYKLDDLAAPDDNTDLDFSTAKHGLVPKGTDVGNFLKDDGTWAAGGGGESNTASNQGSGVSVYFQKAGVDLQFNAIKSENNRLAVALDGATHDVELTLVEGNIDHDALANTHANPYKLDDLAAPDDNTDLDFSTTKHGLAPKGTDVGDYLKDDGTWDTPAGGGAIDYLDNFEDASIHWSWRTHNLDANRTIVEAANKLTIAIAGGTNGNWWSTLNNAPKIFTGVGRPPCEIITKLITVTTNNETRCGIFVSSNPIAFGVDYAMLLTRSTVGGVEGLQVQRSGTGYTTYQGAPYTTLPMWLKIQVIADVQYGNHLRFYYSTDGINWTELADPAGGYSDLRNPEGFVVGLYVENWSAFNAVSAEFDFFKVVPSLGADG